MPTLVAQVKDSLGTARFMRPWIGGHAQFLISQFSRVNRNDSHGFTDRDHMKAAADWLCRAQDATPDGGIVGRYRLNIGWTSSYPETTGYIIPTFLRLAGYLGDESYWERAREAVRFLLGLQLESGAFPEAEIHENRNHPSPFNTGQIINGLVEWSLATGDQNAIEAAIRAGDWLVSVQDPDGAFRRYFYDGEPATYSTHLTCWLAQLGLATGNQGYLEAVNRHLDWVLGHVELETGWIERAGFDPPQHRAREGFTHTIAYTIWGLLYSGRILDRRDVLDVVMRASAAIARRLELDGSLPGLLDWKWRRRGQFSCLTGNAQMALIWMELYKGTGDVWWLNPAFKALDEIKQAQPMLSRNPGIRGGIPGSFPVWGHYIFGGLPNWAAKFFIDALMEKEAILGNFAQRTRPPQPVKDGLPTGLPPIADPSPVTQTGIVVLTRANSPRLAHLVSEWDARGIRPDAVVFETPADEPRYDKVKAYIRDHGVDGLIRRLFGIKAGPQQPDAPTINVAGPNIPAAEYCRRQGYRVVTVGPLSDPKSWKRIAGLKPKLLVLAGVGIIREGLCKTPSLGIVNAHMSILPFYRGMNVAEWARLNGHRNGCTVHLITDRGIDTGDILLTRAVDTRACGRVANLRQKVDAAQRECLADVVEYVAKTGALPPAVPQTIGEGRQYYKLQTDLLEALEEELLRHSKSG